MRLIGLIVSGALAVAVVAEGAYIIHTRRQLDRLETRLEALSGEPIDLLGEGDGPRAGRFVDAEEGSPASRRVARSLPPPRLVAPPAPAAAQPATTSDDPLPLPPAVDTPEGREQLRRFVVAQMEQERAEGRIRAEQRFTEREQARRDRLVKELGLSPAEGEKFNQIMNNVQAARTALRSRIESGELNRDTIGREMTALRETSDKQLRDLLGDERMKKFEETRRGGPGAATQGGGRRWGAGGGGGWGPPGGRPTGETAGGDPPP
jgi:hypothetical protein